MSFRSHNNNSSSKKRKHSASSSSSSESVATSSSSSSASDRNSNTNPKKRGAPSSPSAASSSSSSSPSSLPSSLKKARMMSSGSSASPSRTSMNGPQRKQPVKKLTIKGLSVRPQLPQDFEQTTWEKLKLAVQAVHKKQPVHYGEEELYKATENLCSNKLGGSLYKKIEAECKLHVQEVLSRLLAQAQNSQQLELEGSFLYLVNNCWKDHCANMLFIRSIFLYLDRTYVLQNAEVCSLWDMGLNQFRDHIAVHPQVKGRVVSGILTLIEKERLGETVDRMLLKSLSDMFIALQIYMTELEPVFLRASESFYAKEGSQCILDMETADYLKHVEERLRHEEQRIQHYLSEVTKRPLISVVEKQLIAAHVDTLIAKGTNFLLENDRREDLTRMYSLFLRVQALPQLKTAWTAYIKSAGTDIVMDEERDALMVQRLLDFRAKLMLILHQAFRDEPSFTHAVKEAFEAFVNVRRTRPAELIAKFVDSKLRSGNKAASEEELDGLMDQVVTIFRYLNGKDVFEAFYKKDLAKRLLLNKSASIDAEKSMVSKLKIECGSVFTSKLEGMFKDVELSKDIMNSFRQSAKHMEQLGKEIELNVHVLTTGCWPAYTPIEIKLPQQLSHCQEVFREFYTSKYSGRRLLWQNSLGSCTLRAAFPKGRKELSVSLFQTVILLLFNDTEAMSYADIAEATGLEEKELKRTLQSLACGRVRVLLKRPKGKEVEKEDVFHYNKEFRQKLYRIKINSIQMKETEEENTKTKESVFQDRQYQIDAAIVRIMKMRKTLSHNLLMSELYQQLKFPLKPADVKKRIESLIDRDYLERDSKNASLYNYLA